MTLPRYTGVTVQTATNAPAPAATVTVNLHNTSVPADLFSDENGATPLANPLTSDAVTGLFTFCVANGLYDITVTGLTVTPYTIPGVQLVYQGAPVGQMLVASATLAHADLLALPTTPFSLIAAPGAGVTPVPLLAHLTTSFVAAYTNIDPTAWLGILFWGAPDPTDVLSYVPNDPAITTGSATRFSDLFASTSPKRQILIPFGDTENLDGWGILTKSYLRTDVDNQPLQLKAVNGALGNLTGGDPTNTLAVTVAYLLL